MEYGIWSLQVAGELWGDPRFTRNHHHSLLPPNAPQIFPGAPLALNALHNQPAATNIVPLPLALNALPSYNPLELVTKSSGVTNSDIELSKNNLDVTHNNNNNRDNDDGDDNDGNQGNENIIEQTENNANQNSEQIGTNENEDEEESETESTESSHRSTTANNNNFPTKFLDPMSCFGLDNEGAVSPVLNSWVLSAYTAMLGRLSAAAATTALGAAQVTNLTSDSDSESETSSFTERSRGNSPNAQNVSRGYSCGSCNTVTPTRPALRKHIADCHPTTATMETREARTCPATSCDFSTSSRCELETHVAGHVAQGMTPTGKKRTLALQRVRYEREEYRCTLCSYACTIEKAFQRHLRAHARGNAPETRVSCAVCGADRSSEVDLSRHMRRHRDDRYFCCDICIFRTVQLKKLIQHRRMHTGEKPHLCPHCAYRSARRDNLRSHVRRVHKKENLYCDTFSPRGMMIPPTINNLVNNSLVNNNLVNDNNSETFVVQSPTSSPSSNRDSTN